MNDNPRHLILTSDQSTWKFDRPVIFLGRWCQKEKDRPIWTKMDFTFPLPVGSEKSDREFLQDEARRIEFDIFDSLFTILNNFHEVQETPRYWRILIGHWLREVVQLLLNRFVTLERCLKENQISGLTFYSESVEMAANNYGDIWSQSMDPKWNLEIFKRIFEELKIKNVRVDELESQPSSKLQIVDLSTQPFENISRLIIRKIRQGIDRSSRRVAPIFEREDSAFVINSYLPPAKELLLNLSLGDFPYRRESAEYIVVDRVNHNLRKELSLQLAKKSHSKIESFVNSCIFNLIPVNYLEGYANLLKESKTLSWPKEPKFIFTSNKYISDELFKIWTANKIANGTPYFVGQHGNTYGTNKFYQNTIEEITSDKFLTWGWKRELPQHTPAFIFKNASNPKIYKSKQHGLLFIQENPMGRFNVWDQSDDFEKYMNDQFVFVSNLSDRTRSELKVRLHPGYSLMWGEGDLRWFNYDKNIIIDHGNKPIRKLWNENRLIVHSYDSTGILETLESNRPTIAFWQRGLEHLVEEAIPFYEQLINSGIVHLSAKSAASKVNEIWTDVDKWWMSRDIQKARIVFCNEYARTSKKPIRDLKKLLVKNL